MNRIVMVIWGLIIVMLCALLLLIGYKERDTEYIDFQNSLKNATKLYIKDNGLSSKNQLVFIKDLVENNYFNDEKDIKKYCAESVLYNETLIKDEFIINKNCESGE